MLKKRDEQRLEAAQMKFLRRLLGITRLDSERNQSVREKLGVQNTVLELSSSNKSGYNRQREWQRQDTQTGIEI
jgi:hypothetical protein